MPLNPMPSIPGTQSDSGVPPEKPANNDRWGKFGIKNPSGGSTKATDDNDTGSYKKGGLMAPMKGEGARAASYAEGGAVLGRTREFLKEASPFRSSVDGVAPANQRPIAAGGEPGEPGNIYGKGGAGNTGNPSAEPNPKGKDKSLKTVMPRK